MVVDTEDFELSLSEEDIAQFQALRPLFIELVERVVRDLLLADWVEYIKVATPTFGRAELYRGKTDPWPGKRFCLEVYPNRYLDERLLFHEFGHESDRRNPSMGYDPSMEERWRQKPDFEMAANISLDARLGSAGLGRAERLRDFRRLFGPSYDAIFDEAWDNPA